MSFQLEIRCFLFLTREFIGHLMRAVYLMMASNVFCVKHLKDLREGNYSNYKSYVTFRILVVCLWSVSDQSYMKMG